MDVSGLRCAGPIAVPISTLALLVAVMSVFPHNALGVPSFARQTDLPCSQCHTLAFGPALTPYGRQFKLNGYTAGKGKRPMPLAFMIQGGFSRTDTPVSQAQAPHFSTNNNLSVDQASVFLGTRLTEHLGMLGQATYSGEQRHFNWDNLDVRYARTLSLFGTNAVVGVSVNNNPTVQDLWNSTPAWGFPYITSPLLPTPGASALINGALAQRVLGVSGYTMVHDHVYFEAGLYRGLSDRWLNNVGLYSSSNPHIVGGAPYWRAAYQLTQGSNYFSVGTFEIDVKMQPDPSVPDTDAFRDVGFDAVYQYSGSGPGGILVNASHVHEKQDLSATFRGGGAATRSNQLDVSKLDASYVYRQTWSAGVGIFDSRGGSDLVLHGPAPLTGSGSGSPNSRGYTLQLEYVPFGKRDSWGRPWVNVRLGAQYTGYLRFNGGTSNLTTMHSGDRAARTTHCSCFFGWRSEHDNGGNCNDHASIDPYESDDVKEKHVKPVTDESRRRLLKSVTLGVALLPIAELPLRAAIAADLPLVTGDDPTAKALKYVSDASKASGAKPGSKCANCSNYQGAAGSAQGGCLLFPGKAVKATGWCSSWTAKT